MTKRTLNVVLCFVFLGLLALPLRNLLFTAIPENDRGGGFSYASYVMLFLFGALALVFAFRAIKNEKKSK